ncbi:hypothetical protein HOD83_00400 [Candidatus Woesearchaeota archaeon]|jgi:hypothetical protein|nr:hypothetical protein [Candidatus Woesearchaeota archaeon]MBT4248037.1 hypothetical protein [Candidatus Woesearchaeota archaeon]
MKKGELAFSTIVVAIIALAILIMILVWVFPSLGETFRQTEEIKDSAGLNDNEIAQLECDRLCAIRSNTAFCTNGCDESKCDAIDEDCELI